MTTVNSGKMFRDIGASWRELVTVFNDPYDEGTDDADDTEARRAA